MEAKIIAIWNLLISNYYVLFTAKSKDSKLVSIGASLDAIYHAEVVDIIKETCKDIDYRKTFTTSSSGATLYFSPLTNKTP